MNTLSYILTHTPAQVNQQSRGLYSVIFVAGCVYLLLLFLSPGFRSLHDWLPGKVLAGAATGAAIVGISAYLLH